MVLWFYAGQSNMILIICICIFIFSFIGTFISILQGIKATAEEWSKTLNKYEYLKNRNLNDWDIREGFPKEFYGLTPTKYWKKTLIFFGIMGISGSFLFF